MKNKIKIISLLIIFLILSLSISKADSDLIFESDTIELTDNGNFLAAYDGVEITTEDGLKIYSDKSTYSKITKNILVQRQPGN